MFTDTAFTRANILILDDQPYTIQWMKSSLEVNNYCVEVVDDFLKCKEMLNKGNYDVVLIDIKHHNDPDAGLAFLQEIDHRYDPLIKVAITGDEGIKDQVALPKGADAFIVKENNVQFLRVIGTLIDKRRKETDTLLSSFMEHTSDMMIITNERDVITKANKATEDLLDYTRQELKGKNCSELFLDPKEWEGLKVSLDTKKKLKTMKQNSGQNPGIS